MKIQYKTLLLTLGAVAVLTSCEKNDPLESVVEPGQKVPTAYWEVGSTACKAGESFTFQGKYTVDYEGASPSYSEVWYRVVRDESAAATVKLGGASLNYTKTVADNQVMRSYQPIARFSHDLAEWAGHEFQITGSVPVSRTLKPVNWTDIATWDGDRFDQYYPEGFADEFNNEVINLLTKDSTYYNALRQVYISHPFTMEQFAAANAKYKVNFPTNIDMTKEDNGAGEKSDLWFSTTQASEDAIIGWYYVTIDAAGNKIIHEVAKDVQRRKVSTTIRFTIQQNGCSAATMMTSVPSFPPSVRHISPPSRTCLPQSPLTSGYMTAPTRCTKSNSHASTRLKPSSACTTPMVRRV